MSQLGPYQLNQIYCGECSQMMAALPDNCIDLTVTSPPYDSLRTYNGYTFDFEPIAQELWRVTKPGGVVVWVVGDATENGSETLTSFKQALYFRELGFNVETMVYEREAAYPSNERYSQNFEFMFVFSKGFSKSFNPLREPKYNKGHSGSPYAEGRDKKAAERVLKARLNSDKLKSNVWKIGRGYMISTKDDIAYDHPAIFPEALARDHILSWSNPGDIVLDPLIGSGTTAKQAHLLGRHYLGFDISEEYCQLARRRLANVEAQPFLMPPSAEASGKPSQLGLSIDESGKVW